MPSVKLTRAELMHGDLMWFAIYLMKACTDIPSDESHVRALMDDAARQLSTIKASYRVHRKPGIKLPQ